MFREFREVEKHIDDERVSNNGTLPNRNYYSEYEKRMETDPAFREAEEKREEEFLKTIEIMRQRLTSA